MTATGNALTVFTKSWPEMPTADLAAFIRDLGFDGVELPVRPGFQVPPEDVARGLPAAARIFADAGVKIGSVAGPTDEPTIDAMGEAGIPILRICVNIDTEAGYRASEDKLRGQFDELVPILDRCGVTLGVQNHCGRYVGSAVALVRLIEKYDPKHVGAVLDPAHCGLDGEPEDMAIDVAWPHLVLVNLKNGVWARAEELGAAGEAVWQTRWTLGREGITSWPAVAAELKRRGYDGDLCLSAEYSPPEAGGQLYGRDVDALIADDLAFAKKLFR
jgi:sugar phosphate isomerase/epimerase